MLEFASTLLISSSIGYKLSSQSMILSTRTQSHLRIRTKKLKLSRQARRMFF
jgi:hypothetical protein